MPPSRSRWLKRLGRVIRFVILVCVCIALVPSVVALGRAAVECRAFGGSSAPAGAPAPPTPNPIAAGLSGYARPEDQTYLTLPEWYIVYSSDEYAAFIAHNPPSGFPYFRAIGQFWQSYYGVCGVTRDRYPFNSGYHLSLAVIGASFTIEDTFKGLYEATIGRFAEWTSSSDLTPEDAYARRVAAEYGTFLHTIPWYEFPFSAKLRGLWAETPLWGPNMFRKAERKAALSMEYGLKAVYGWAIKQGTQSVYSAEDLEIQAIATGPIDQLARREPQLRVVKPGGVQALVALPRYEAFTQIVPRLARDGLGFVEIAGNQQIMITIIAPQAWQYDLAEGAPLFAMPILTQPDRKRVAVQLPVGALGRVLGALGGDVALEHIYDY